MDARLLDILVCPVCKGNLEYREERVGTGLQTLPGLSDRDDIPVMLVDEARQLAAEAEHEWIPRSNSRSSFRHATRRRGCRQNPCLISAASRWWCAWLNARCSPVADEVWVATDHDGVFSACREHGLNVLMTRADHPSGTDRLAEVVAAARTGQTTRSSSMCRVTNR